MPYFDDVVIGAPIESATYAVTEAEVIAFARQFDPQPFHVDPEAASHSLFGGLVASGWHTASMMMHLLVQSIFDGPGGRGSPGFDDLRWLKPVRPGDVIRARITYLDKTPSRSRPDIGSCRFRVEVFNQRDEMVMSIIQSVILDRRPAA